MMWLDYRIKRINKSLPKLYQHKKTGELRWQIRPLSEVWHRMPIIYEDELPEGITNDKYNWWYANSIVDIVRMGPTVT